MTKLPHYLHFWPVSPTMKTKSLVCLLFFSCALFFLLPKVTTSSPATRGISDEVQSLVNDLEKVVLAAIQIGHSNINNGIDASLLRRKDNYAQMEIDVQQEFLNVWLRVLKIMELSVGTNIDSCLSREEELLTMPELYRNETTTCLAPWDQALFDIRGSANMIVSGIIMNVYNLQYQAWDCDFDIFCLDPIIKQIEVSHVEIPQKVDVEVQNARDSLDSIDVQVKSCTDSGTASMALNGNLLVDQMAACVDEILGKTLLKN